MTEQAPQTITINDKEYKVEDLTPNQKNTIGLVLRTETRIIDLQGDLAILQNGVDSMKAMLVKDLETPVEEVKEEG